MGATAPLTLPEFAAALDRIGGFERRPLVAVAISGGPDSMALAILADRWARERAGAIRALTVDHGLRPESAGEARQVAAWLGSRGIAHDILRWDGAKPSTGIQEAARAARYRLLAGWCAANGVLHLMTAHQQEDQAETYLIRRRAGSGVDGLAGMSAVRELAGCRLVRPLLDVPRARLAAFLAEEAQVFLDDPSNRSPAFERGRLRRAIDVPAAAAAIAETRRCAVSRIERERELHALLARCVRLHPAGFAALDAAAIRAASFELAERVLARVAGCIGGLHYPPRRERVGRLREALVALPPRGRTLGGCCFVPWRGLILVLRELAAAAPPLRLVPGDRVEWDRRFTASLPSSAPGPVIIGYRGQRSLPCRTEGGELGSSRNADVSPARCGRVGRSPKAIHLPPVLRSILPAAWDETGLGATPYLAPDDEAVGAAAVRLTFRPANPLTDGGHAVV